MDRRQDAKLAADMLANPIRYYRPNKTAVKFHADDHAVKFASGANRSGKSTLTHAEIAMGVSGVDSLWLKREGISVVKRWKRFTRPLRVRVWCPDLGKVARNYLVPMLQGLIPREMLDTARGRLGFNQENSTLHLRDGAMVQFMSYEHELAQAESVSAHVVVFDEPPPEMYFDRQFGRIADVGGFVLGAMTTYDKLVRHPIGWVDRRIRRKGLNREMGADVVAHYSISMFENLHNFSPEGRERMLQWAAMLKARDPAAYDACVLGLPGMLQGLVYKEFQEHIHADYTQAGPEDFVTLAKKGRGEIWGCWDHGMRDPTAILWIYVARRPELSLDIVEGDCIIFREYYVPDKKPGAHLPALIKITKDWPVRGYLCGVDMWGPEAEGPTVAGIYVKGLRDAGCCCRLLKSNRDKPLGHELVGQLLTVPPEDDAFPWASLRICKGAAPRTVDEFLSYCWKPEDKRGGSGGDKVVDRDNHSMDGLRYFACSYPRRRAEKQPTRAMRHPVTGAPLDLLTTAQMRSGHAIRR